MLETTFQKPKLQIQIPKIFETSLNLWSITRNLRIQSGVMMMTRRVLEALEFIIIMKA